MGIEQLENKGFAFINSDKINTEKRQIVVIGAARGGTSLVAGALYHLGVFTGDKSNAPVFEDVLLSEAFESNDLEQAKAIVDRYTEEHDVWAWKRPAALNYLDKIEAIIPNPFYIFIFKDIFAIANRNNISMKADIGKGLQNALANYGKIVDFVSNIDKPVMLVSAEKALQNKESFVNALIEMNKEVEDYSNAKQKAIEFITPNPKDYLDATRLSKSKGSVDNISRQCIKGWAKSVHSEKSVSVCVFVNDVMTVKTSADMYREDLIKAGVSKTGECGFIIDVSNFEFLLNDTIKVMVEHDIQSLKKGEVTIDENSCLLAVL
jgi:hypothetical protein